MKEFEVHCFTKENYERFGDKFPENSYFYDSAEEAIRCLSDLVKNPISGIWKTELVINKFS